MIHELPFAARFAMAASLAVVASACTAAARRAAPRSAPAYLTYEDPATRRARALEELTRAKAECDQARAAPGDEEKLGRATRAFDRFYAKYGRQPERVEDLLVEAAYEDATLRRAAGDSSFRDWYQATIVAYAKYAGATSVPNAEAARLANFAAEAAFVLLDERIRKEWAPPGRFGYGADADTAAKTLERESETREKFFIALEEIRYRYRSRRYLPLLLAREGTLYDAQRDALLATSPQLIPATKLVQIADLEAKCSKIVADPDVSDQARESCRSTLAKMAQVRQILSQNWTNTRASYLHDIEMRLVQRYGAASRRAKELDVTDALVVRADARLTSLRSSLGQAQMQTYLAPPPGSPEAKEWAAAYPLDRCE